MGTCIEFKHNEAKEIEGLDDASIEHFKNAPYVGVGKEAGQNSTDAAKNYPVKMSFRSIEVDRSDVPFADDLQNSLIACHEAAKNRANPKDSELDFFADATKLIKRPKIKILEIADFNTTGCFGPYQQDKPIYALLKGSSVSDKSSNTSAGSFGIGKFATFAVSKFQMVVYVTKYLDELSGEKKYIAQGRIMLISHTDGNGKDRLKQGWWGKPGFMAIEDESEVPSWMRRDDEGVSLFAIGFDDADGWQSRMASGLIRTFFAAIHKGSIEFNIDHKIQVNKASLKDLFEDNEIVDAANRAMASEAHEFSRDLYECLYSETTIRTVKTVPSSGDTEFGDVEIRVLKQEGKPKRVGFIRNGMMIAENLEHFDHPFRRFNMATDFIALVEPVDDAGSALMKKLENPSHDSLSAERISDDQKKREATDVMKRLGQIVRETITELTKTEVDDVEKLDDFAEFFPAIDSDDQEGDDEASPLKLRYTVEAGTRAKKRIRGAIGGTGGGTRGSNGGGGGGGTGGGTGGNGRGGSGGDPFPFERPRYANKGGDDYTLQLTPKDGGKANLSIEALGLNESETIRISNNSMGQLSQNGLSVEVDLNAGARFELAFTVLENYNGPIEIKLTRAHSGDDV